MLEGEPAARRGSRCGCSRREHLGEVDGAHGEPAPLEPAADVHQARGVARADARRRRSRSTRRSLSASIAVETSAFLTANVPPKPQHSFASASATELDARDRAEEATRAVADAERPERVAGRVVRERARRSPSRRPRPRARSTRNCESSQRPAGDALGIGPRAAPDVLPHLRGARAGRRHDGVEAREDLDEPPRERSRHVRVAGVRVQLAAAGLLAREDDLDPEPLEHASRSPARPTGSSVSARQVTKSATRTAASLSSIARAASIDRATDLRRDGRARLASRGDRDRPPPASAVRRPPPAAARLRDDDRRRDAVRRQRRRLEDRPRRRATWRRLRWTELRVDGRRSSCLAVVLALLRRRAAAGRTRDELALLAFYGIVGFALVQWLYFVAIERLPIGIGLLFEFTAPVLVALWARFVWHEPVRRRVWPALALVLGGLALVAAGLGGRPARRRRRRGGPARGRRARGLLPHGRARWSAAATRSRSICFALGFAALFWAIVQPWWSFPFDALGETVSLQGELESLNAPGLARSALWVIVLGTIVPFALSLAALRHLPATTVGIVAMFEVVLARVRRLGLARRDARRGADRSAAASSWSGSCSPRPRADARDGTLSAMSRARPPRLAPRLLRRRRARRRDGREGARALRRAGLRPQADRPQHPRRPRPRGAGRDLRRGGDARSPPGATVVYSAHGVAPVRARELRARSGTT